MARPKKNHVQLSDSDVKKLKQLLKHKNTNQTAANRCRILLSLDENHPPALSYDQCVATYGVSKATISTVVKSFADGGVDSVLNRKRSINSDNARRKVDGRVEARLIEVACSPAPEGHSRWTIRLLEDEMKIILDEPISHRSCCGVSSLASHSVLGQRYRPLFSLL
jgi:transposase